MTCFGYGRAAVDGTGEAGGRGAGVGARHGSGVGARGVEYAVEAKCHGKTWRVWRWKRSGRGS